MTPRTAAKAPPSRQLPQRAARSRAAAGPAPAPQHAMRNTGGRVTRSSAALHFLEDRNDTSSSLPPARVGALKRTSSTVSLSTRQSKRPRHQSGFYDEASDDASGEPSFHDVLGDEASRDDGNGNAYPSPKTDSEDRALLATIPTTKRPLALRSTPKKEKRPSTQSPRVKRPCKRTPDGDGRGASAPALDRSPPWTELPYFILVQIFEAASAPLDEASARWLLTTSRVCRSFAEPALTALYKSPPLLTAAMAHHFVDFVSDHISARLFNYRQKVKRLELDVETVVSKTYRGRQLDLQALVSNLPGLKEVDFWHRKDQPPYRQLDDNLRWHYPSWLFEGFGIWIQPDGTFGHPSGLHETPTKLRGWRWNSRMLGAGEMLDSVRVLHLTPCFCRLRKIGFVNFQLPSLHAADPDSAEIQLKDSSFITRLADCISVLPELRHLVIESSTAVNGQFLSLLPRSIQHLELINCWDVNAEELAEYLLAQGAQLRRLTLHHCQSLSLAFLPVLATACPSLESLSMDFTYFKHHEFYSDSDPCYDALLTADQIPSWPSSLQHIRLKNMRKWDVEAAEAFFRSLVDSAASLPMLRCLDIKATLDIPIRQRSRMRDRWVAKLGKVFRRQCKDPLPTRSLRPQEGDESRKPLANPSKRQRNSAPESPVRRSHRIATQLSGPSSRASSVGANRGLRYLDRRLSYADPDSDDDFGDQNEDGEGDDRDPQAAHGHLSPETGTDHVQGMCDVVDIIIDNQRTVEHQWHMDDFLDAVSDDYTDDEWNGDMDDDDDYYAW